MAFNYSKHSEVLTALSEAQKSEIDMRRMAREAKHFITKRGGMWDQDAVDKIGTDRYRGQFDMCTPVITQITSDLDSSDFTLVVKPSGGESSEDNAKILNGLIRTIRNISSAENVFNQATRSMVIGGLDGWEVIQKFIDADSVDQDLVIKKIPNYIDRVWFDQNSEEQDHSDAEWVIVLQSMGTQEYKDQFSKGTGVSVGDQIENSVYFNKKESIIVGRLLYKKSRKIELVQMSNGAVYRDDEKFKSVQDDLLVQGIQVTKTRTRDSWRVYSRLFDGADWLIDEEETVFDLLPIVAEYGNFEIVENKRIYSGKVEKMIDPQRILNYAVSRDIEDGALSPKPKFFMTTEQAEGHDKKLSTLNTNRDAVQFYKHVAGQPPPFFAGGQILNQGLQNTINFANNAINQTAGLFGSNLGDNPNLQSGKAIGLQIDQGNNSSLPWFSSKQVALCYTGKVMVNSAISRTYDATRQVQLLSEDGTSKSAIINQPIVDQATGQVVQLNDLTIGQYDVICEVGAEFKSKQEKTVQAFLDLAALDPSILQTGKDILLKATQAPGMDLVADRVRPQLIDQGVIPEDQLTDDERQQIQAAQEAATQNPPQPDPALIIAQAEMLKGQAEMQAQENKATELQISVEKIKAEIQGKDKKLESDLAVSAAKIDQEDEKISLQADKQVAEQELKGREVRIKELEAQVKILESLTNAVGADAVISPQVGNAIEGQVELVNEAQQQV